MEKPLSVKRDEFCKAIIKAVNEAELPAFVVLEVLRGITQEAANAAQRQLEEDRRMYYNSTTSEEEAEND